jgi:hypothetical protein
MSMPFAPLNASLASLYYKAPIHATRSMHSQRRVRIQRPLIARGIN